MEAATRVVPRLGIIVPKSIFDVGLGIFYIPVNQNQNENSKGDVKKRITLQADCTIIAVLCTNNWKTVHIPLKNVAHFGIFVQKFFYSASYHSQ